MSWVTNILLMYSLGEEYFEPEDDEGIEYSGTSPCLTAVNNWLSEQGRVTLLDLTEWEFSKVGSRHRFEACIWGAAVNGLDIDAFLCCVKSQAWQEPENVQILLKDQEESKFTLVTLPEIECH